MENYEALGQAVVYGPLPHLNAQQRGSYIAFFNIADMMMNLDGWKPSKAAPPTRFQSSGTHSCKLWLSPMLSPTYSTTDGQRHVW